MNCKNCERQLEQSDKYCANCGAKVVNTRLAFSYFLSEFNEEVLSWDNRLFKTIWHLVIKPEEVILGYLNGVRKKYMNPFRFLLIILTLYGIAIFFTRDVAINEMTILADENQRSITKNMMNFLFDYNSIFTSLLVPFYAIISFVIFLDKRKLNFFEHIVLWTYVQTIYSVLGIISTLPVFFLSQTGNLVLSSIINITWLIYALIIFKKVFGLTVFQTILKFLLFSIIIIFLIILLAIIILLGIYFIEGKEFFTQFVTKK